MFYRGGFGFVGILLLCLLIAVGSGFADNRNLLENPGFETVLDEDDWSVRFRQSESRRAFRTSDASMAGDWSLAIEVVGDETSFSSVTQGVPGQRFGLDEGDLVEYSGWVKTEFSEHHSGAGIRIYFFDAEGSPISERRAPQLTGHNDWTMQNLVVEAPAGTASCTVYLNVYGGGTGRAYFDQLSLHIQPREEPDHQFLLITDSEEDDPTVASLKVLYPERIALAAPGELPELATFKGVIAFSRGHGFELPVDQLEAFVEAGGRLVLDLALYGQMRNLEVRDELVEREQALLHVKRGHMVTRGFAEEDYIPWHYDREGQTRQRWLSGEITGQILAETGESGALLVAEEHGSGFILATDLTHIPEPMHRLAGAYNKYLFMGNLLGDTVRYGRHYNERYSYHDFTVKMQDLADRHDTIRIRDEGPASGGYRIYSLAMGDPGKPAFFLYAAAHGSEWEPGYGLLALAELLAEKPDQGLFDFSRYSLIMVPLMNPAGYDLFRRTNANGVDLNRNSSFGWEQSPAGEGTGRYKGESPASEPESQTFRSILQRVEPFAFLDFHGNLGGSGNNRLIIIPYIEERNRAYQNEYHARLAVARLNHELADRYVLQQARRPGVHQYEKESVWNDSTGGLGRMQNYAASLGAMGFLSEPPAQNRGAFHLVFNTDLTIETCLAFFRTYEMYEQSLIDHLELPYLRPDLDRLQPLTGNPGKSEFHPDYGFGEARQWTWKHPARYLLFANRGDQVTVQVQHRDPTSRQEGEDAEFTVTGPNHEQVYRQDLPFFEVADIHFTAPNDGIYRIEADPGRRGVVTIQASTHPVNMDLHGDRVMLRWSQGDYYFWIPAGTDEFAVRVSGRRTGGVRAKLFDADGALVEASGDSWQHQFHVRLPEPSQGEAWKLQMTRPAGIPSASVFIELVNLPSLVAPSREALLVQ